MEQSATLFMKASTGELGYMWSDPAPAVMWMLMGMPSSTSASQSGFHDGS